jgi:hypothetical protein
MLAMVAMAMARNFAVQIRAGGYDRARAKHRVFT